MMSIFKLFMAGAVLLSLPGGVSMAQDGLTRYVRYEHQGQESYAILEGDSIQVLEGDLFGSPRESGATIALADVRLLAPCKPSKVIAIGLNYRSHLGERPVPESLGVFSKFPTSVIAPEEAIVIPADSEGVHFEGELVVVIGKEASKVPVEDAPQYILGVTAGNDVSERTWQGNDLQWFRAKGSDTFAPLGPAIVTGLNYNDLTIETRLNGEVKQHESSADLIFGVDEIVSFVSRYVTLFPGDIIFTGTPGSTSAMRPGDVVEVEIEGIGILRSAVTKESKE